MASNSSADGLGTAFSKGGVGTADLIVIVIYLILCMLTGLWVRIFHFLESKFNGHVSSFFTCIFAIVYFLVPIDYF